MLNDFLVAYSDNDRCAGYSVLGQTGAFARASNTVCTAGPSGVETIASAKSKTGSGNVSLDIDNIVCFTSGTGILTPRGLQMIEDLQAGDTVITRDNGLQPIRWIGRRTVPAIGKLAPICFATGSLPNLTRPLLVSPQHRMLFGNHRSRMHLGQSEVLVCAKHLVNGTNITRNIGGEVTYLHMLFDRHEIVYADGTASESFHPRDISMQAISDKARNEIFDLFPDLRADPSAYGNTARKCLCSHEVQMVA